MIYPYTASLHGLIAGLCLASLIYLFYRKSDENRPAIDAYFNWFLFFFLYNFSLFIPLVITDGLNQIAGVFYILAIFFLAFAAWHAFRVSLEMGINPSLKNFLSSFFIIGAVAAVFVQIFYFEIPIGTADGNWVFWHTNRLTTVPYHIFMFAAGWSFSWQFIKGSLITSGVQRFRSIFLALGAFLLPFASPLYFGVSRIFEIYLAFVATIAGITFFAVANIVLGLVQKRIK